MLKPFLHVAFAGGILLGGASLGAQQVVPVKGDVAWDFSKGIPAEIQAPDVTTIEGKTTPLMAAGHRHKGYQTGSAFYAFELAPHETLSAAMKSAATDRLYLYPVWPKHHDKMLSQYVHVTHTNPLGPYLDIQNITDKPYTFILCISGLPDRPYTLSLSRKL